MRGGITPWPAVLLGLLLATQAAAEGPDSTLRPSARPPVPVAEEGRPPPDIERANRPTPRPQTATPAAPLATPVAPGPVTLALATPAPPLRPVMRPGLRPDMAIGAATQPQARAEENLFAFSPLAPRAVDRPALRPAAFVQQTPPPAPAVAAAPPAQTRGQICGDPQIIGDVINDIDGPGGCGVVGAVRVRSVAGVQLTAQPTIDCGTAKALRRWVTDGVLPAVGDTGGGVAALRIMGHYTCRNRVGGSATNNKLSEHGRGRAVDIGGIQLRNGREITVLTDWNSGTAGEQLKAMWRAACGRFGTVLGPNANAAHRDHFHFDTAGYRSGGYCR